MQKIAVLGGTFNPIHNGHIRLALSCHKELGFDKILVVPTNVPPHKETSDLCSNRDRLEMCRLAVKGMPVFEVTDLEYRLGGRSYTVNTLRALRKEYPKARFYLLVGSDMFFTFRQWRSYRDILSGCTLVGASRNFEEHQKMQEMSASFQREGFDTVVIENDVYVLSSTELRRLMQEYKDISAYVNADVLQYIREHSLFGGGVIDGTGELG